jgi:hypothetical protein
MGDPKVFVDSPVAEGPIFNEVIDWGKVTNEELVKMLSERVIYNTDDIIAFDKPVSVFQYFVIYQNTLFRLVFLILVRNLHDFNLIECWLMSRNWLQKKMSVCIWSNH